MMTYDETLATLTGPGAMFEIGIEEVGGRSMKNFKNRERSIREKIANAAARGDDVCLVYGERSISYARFAALVWGTAANLRDRYGLVRGDRLAVLAYNRPEWLFSLFGATAVAGIGVALNGWWSTEELAYGLSDSGARYLVVDESLYPRIEPLVGGDRPAGLEGLETVFYIGEQAPPGTVPIAELIEEKDEVPTEAIDEDDPFAILYTSGTTGRSKGCITTHRGTITQVLAIILAGAASSLMGAGNILPTEGQLVGLYTSPLFHVAGLHSGICTALTAGARIIFLQGKFDPDKVMALLEKEKVNMWPAIPAMLHRVVHAPNIGDYDLSNLRSISFGGAPTAPETIDRARQVLPAEPVLTNAYGLTETHGVATVNAGKDLPGRKTAAGRVTPVLDVKIIDGDGAAVATGELGEVLFYGPTITPGYWNRPDATAETVRDGWLYTGDIGYVDEEGFLFIVDRAKDMILRGGENVYCAEIEACLAEHPDIDEAAIIGVADAELGERVKAIVRLTTGASMDEKGVKAHVGRHLAVFKVPEFVEFIDTALPRNPAGKILKNQLRGQA